MLSDDTATAATHAPVDASFPSGGGSRIDRHAGGAATLLSPVPVAPAPLGSVLATPVLPAPVLLAPAEIDSLVAVLDAPELVFSDGYIGTDRRRAGLLARVRRATFGQRRSLLRVELVVAALVALLIIATVVLTGAGRRSVPSGARSAVRGEVVSPAGARILAAAPSVFAQPTTTSPVTEPAAAATTPSTAVAPPSGAPAGTPQPTTPQPATPPAAAPAATAPVAAPPAAAGPATLTPAEMGAQALALVRYPWQKIPGYTIQFLPISDAPSPGFYGNTTFTWGRAGGSSVLYVYPGETVDRLAGIAAFEIGHEVDAAAVQPQGGEAQIENILGIHPASWAPNCDCAEQGFLSGWYSAAFSDYWSPGVGSWSTIAPPPSGAVLAAVEPWLNPVIP